MENWKTIVILIILGLSVWLLAPRTTQEEVGADVVEITYMGPGGPIWGAMADAVMAFEHRSLQAHKKDPSKPIYRVISGQNGARDQTGDPTRFLISVAGGMPPDVIYFDRFAVAEWAARGAFTPLNDFIEKDLVEDHPNAVRPDRYYKAAWDEANYQGKTYGIPISIDSRALVYNKDLLRRAELVDSSGNPVPPKNWEQLREYAAKLTQRDRNGNISLLGFAPNYGNAWLYIYGWMNGAQFMSDDGKTCTLNEPRIVEALEYMTTVYDDSGGYEKVSAFQSGFQGGALDPMITGKIAMKIDGYHVMSFMAQFGRDLDFGVYGAPTSPEYQEESGQEVVSWSGGWSLAIPVNAKHKQGAWELIRFLTSDEGWRIRNESQKETIEAQGNVYIPEQMPMKDLNMEVLDEYVLSNPRIPERIKEGCVIYNDLLKVSKFRPITPVGQVLWQQHVEATEVALYKKKTPTEALNYGTVIVQRELNKILNPPEGIPVNWTYFFFGYALLVILLIFAAYTWDTNLGARRFLAKLFWRKKQIGPGDLIEGSQGGYFRAQWWAGYFFVSPWVIGFIIFGGGPLLFSILMSFCDYDVINPAKWIGLENYRWMFTKDELFPVAFKNTVFMVLGVPFGMVASLSIALLLNMKIRGISVWRTIFYLPAIVPAVASYVLWVWIFNPAGGFINQTLEIVGINGPNWLGSEVWSKPSLILMGLWTAGGGMLIWLAGLKSIPEHYYEAASIDGASEWQQFLYITFPMLTPYIFFNLVMGMIAVFQIFDAAFIMTAGGPVNSTLFYVYHLFNNAFRFGHMGYACAMAWILFVIILGLTIIQLKVAKKWVHYETE